MTTRRYVFKSRLKRAGMTLLDAAGQAASAIVRTVSFKNLRVSRGPAPKKILLIRLDHIGDVMLTRPAVRSLREKYPSAQIDWLVPSEVRGLLQGDTSVNRILGLTNHWFRRGGFMFREWSEIFQWMLCLRAEKYDAAVEFRGDLRSLVFLFLLNIPVRIGYGITGGKFLLTQCADYDWTAHQAELCGNLVRLLGASAPLLQRPLVTQPDLFSQDIPAKSPGIKRVIVHAGAGYPSKLWPSENFEALLRGLCGLPEVEIVLIGTAAEKSSLTLMSLGVDKNRVLDCRGVLALDQLPPLMLTSDLFIGGDSGPAHIAAAQGIPVISLFSGANDAELWKPWTPRLVLLRHPVPCSPCGLSVCPLPDHPCMKGIDPAKAVQAASGLLEGTSAS